MNTYTYIYARIEQDLEELKESSYQLNIIFILSSTILMILGFIDYNCTDIKLNEK